MNNYMAIAAAAEGLRHVLWDSFRSDARTARYVQSRQGISLRSPADAAKYEAHQLSVWLYGVSPVAPEPSNPPLPINQRNASPLPLDLHFLVTPLSPDGDLDLMLIGKVLQTLNASPSILLVSDLEGFREHVQITQANPSPDEMSRIWASLKEPYRLAVCYRARLTRIDAKTPLPAGCPVVDRFSGHGFSPIDTVS
ncbi:MAG: DUF4255 domain-containing protein [Rhodospirillaceae bacterium]